MTTNFKPEFGAMTGAELVRTWNEMVLTAVDLGSNQYKAVQRFANQQVGVRRCEALHSSIVALRASAAAADKQEQEKDLRPPELVAKEEDRREMASMKRTEGSPEAAPEAAAQEVQSDGEATPAATESESEDDMAKKAKKAKAKRASNGSGVTVRELTDQFNKLVPQGKKAGATWAKHHTSLFGSLEGAKTQLKRLQDAIRKGG